MDVQSSVLTTVMRHGGMLVMAAGLLGACGEATGPGVCDLLVAGSGVVQAHLIGGRGESSGRNHSQSEEEITCVE
jgi:hypothetical protein